MKREAAELIERSALGGGLVGISWGLQEASQLASFILTIVTCGWILTQWVKFVFNWWHEIAAKRAAKRNAQQGGQNAC